MKLYRPEENLKTNPITFYKKNAYTGARNTDCDMLLKLRVNDSLGIVNAILRLAWGNRNLSPDENQHITIAPHQVRRN